MSASSTMGWIPIVALILFLGLMSGVCAGLCGLWKARRGAAWWLMAVGTAFGTVGPILYAAGTWMLFDALRSSSSAGTPASFGPSGVASVILMAGGLLLPAGLILFSVGFAVHGHAAARIASRAEELEQLATAMSQEIHQLRQGGPTG